MCCKLDPETLLAIYKSFALHFQLFRVFDYSNTVQKFLKFQISAIRIVLVHALNTATNIVSQTLIASQTKISTDFN